MAASIGAVAAVLCLIAIPAPLSAQSRVEPNKNPRGYNDTCITLTNVRRSEIVDDRTILFHLRNGHVKRVTLAFPCPSLKFYGSFGYEAYSNRLCARVDTIVSRAGTHCPIGDISDQPPPPDMMMILPNIQP
ncbi:hypothetical protein [Govanella unica]|uniref:Uncharacterized protein n=1 Tax=Govanella unica TaxID=2975056 RepID=A0A9X3TY91_9PROT|nr:hypothetical protein [Govania unica]MDA5193934.1 hypothetical protein [Govania unica]